MTSRSARRTRVMMLALFAATVAALPATASAAECASGATSQAFARFGDAGHYYLAPNGGFESALTWSRGGSAALVAGNEPFNLAGAGGYALRLRKDGWTTTPKLCVSPATPHLRFVAKATGSGQLGVEVRFWENGQVTDSSSGSVSPSDHASWAPSRSIGLKVDKLGAGQTGSVTVHFKSQGDWRIDDVFIDPYRRG